MTATFSCTPALGDVRYPVMMNETSVVESYAKELSSSSLSMPEGHAGKTRRGFLRLVSATLASGKSDRLDKIGSWRDPVALCPSDRRYTDDNRYSPATRPLMGHRLYQAGIPCGEGLKKCESSLSSTRETPGPSDVAIKAFPIAVHIDLHR